VWNFLRSPARSGRGRKGADDEKGREIGRGGLDLGGKILHPNWTVPLSPYCPMLSSLTVSRICHYNLGVRREIRM